MKRRILVILLVIMLVASCGGGNSDVEGLNIDQEFLPVEKAFRFSSKANDDNTLKLSWKIAEGYHLYKNKFEFALEPESARIADIAMPKGVILDDENFGRQETYVDHVDIQLKLKPQPDLKNVVLSVKYQGCSEKGLCYPPQTQRVKIR